jgi:tripartite-type tricarboxylate transporter receptor subunit TctC
MRQQNRTLSRGSSEVASLKTIARAVLLSLFLTAPAAAQSYPDKPVRIIVPYAAGGITDILARALAQQLTDRWGQQVIVENRPGGNSQIGAEYVARSVPDGYTLLVSADTTFVMAPHLYRDQKFDPLQDFAPITGLGVSPHALAAHPSVPVNSVAELIAYGRDHPGALNYGTFGIGSSGHLNVELIQMMTGARFTPVHYGGATPAINDLLGGHIQFTTVSIGLVAQSWKAGLLKVLAIGSKQRLKEFPDTPTLAESGLKDFEAGSWYGLVAPKGTPPEIIAKINQDTAAAFNNPAFQQKMLAPNFAYSIVSSPQDFAAMMRRESDKWKKVIDAANIKLD